MSGTLGGGIFFDSHCIVTEQLCRFRNHLPKFLYTIQLLMTTISFAIFIIYTHAVA